MLSKKTLLVTGFICVALFCSISQAKAAKNVSGTININTASISELMLLPGVGKSKAEAIIDYRTNSPFKTIEELKEIKGIGDKIFISLKDLVTTTGPTTAKLLDIKKTNIKPGGSGSAN